MKASQKLLLNQMSEMKREPITGIAVDFANDENVYEWYFVFFSSRDVYIAGPGDTVFEGGIFRLKMNFPTDYPYSPPSLQFVSKFWHPNVYENGKVCISILHPPGNDPMSGERPEERWNPTQSPTTILLSVQSMIADPNISSPANVDASVEWRNDKASFAKKIRQLIDIAKKDIPEGFEMPKEKKRFEIKFDMDDDDADVIDEYDLEQEIDENPEVEEEEDPKSHHSEEEEIENMHKVKDNLTGVNKKKKIIDTSLLDDDMVDDEVETPIEQTPVIQEEKGEVKPEIKAIEIRSHIYTEVALVPTPLPEPKKSEPAIPSMETHIKTVQKEKKPGCCLMM